MEIPGFIFDLLSEELKNSHISLLKKVATKYALNENQLIEEFVQNVTITPNTTVAISIKKDYQPKETAEKCIRCMARVWNRGKGGQCTRLRKNNEDYCGQHMTDRKHGRIDEKVPRELFPNKASALYK
jgi:cytochrome c553